MSSRPSSGQRDTGTHITDYQLYASAPALQAVDAHHGTVSHLPLQPCIDDELLRMVSTTPLHPMRCRRAAEYHRVIDSAAATSTAAVSVASPLGYRPSVLGFNTASSTAAFANGTGGNGGQRGSQGTAARGAASGRTPRTSTRNSVRTGTLMSSGAADSFSKPGGPKTSLAFNAVPSASLSLAVPVTAQHILDGRERALVLGYEDGSVRLVHLRHQENHDDGVRRSEAAVAAAPEPEQDLRHWSLAELLACSPECTPPMVTVTARGTELAVSRLDASSATACAASSEKRNSQFPSLPASTGDCKRGPSNHNTMSSKGWSPVVAVHAVPCAVSAAQLAPASSQPTTTAGAVVALAYQDCVLVMLEPFAVPATSSSSSLSATQRKRATVGRVRAVVSAATLRSAFAEAKTGVKTSSGPRSAVSVPHHGANAAAAAAGGAGSGSAGTAGAGAGASAGVADGPISVVGVRVSPCGHYVAVHLAAPALCVLVFELPSFYDTTSSGSSEGEEELADAAGTARPPLRFVAGCCHHGDVRLGRLASPPVVTPAAGAADGTAAAASTPLQTTTAAAVYAESVFLTNATDTPEDPGSPSTASFSTMLVVAWVNAQLFCRLPLQATTAQTACHIQRALQAADDVAHQVDAFDNAEAIRSGRPTSSPSSRRGRVSSARRDRARQSVAGNASAVQPGSSGGGGGAGTSSRRRSATTPHSPPSSSRAQPRPGSSGRHHRGSTTRATATSQSLLAALDGSPCGSGGGAPGTFAHAVYCATVQPIQCVCPVSGDARLVLLGLVGGTVQVVDAQSTTRALFSVVPPSRVPLAAAESLQRQQQQLQQLGGLSGKSADAFFQSTFSESAHGYDVVLDANQSLISEAGSCHRASPPAHSVTMLSGRAAPSAHAGAATSVGATTMLARTAVSKPAPAMIDIDLLQAFAGDGGELIVVATTTSRVVPKARPVAQTTAEGSGADPTARPSCVPAGNTPAAGSRAPSMPSVRVSRPSPPLVTAAATAGPTGQNNNNNTSGGSSYTGGEEMGVGDGQVETLTVYGAALIRFTPQQRSAPSERSYLTHLPGPARAVLPLWPLPAALVSVVVPDCAASAPSSPLAGAGLLAGLGHVGRGSTTASAGPGSPDGHRHQSTTVHLPDGPPSSPYAYASPASTSPLTTLWWDTAHDVILGTVPTIQPRRPRAAPTLLESLHGGTGTNNNNESTTELISSSMPSRTGTASGASTRGAASGASRRQLARAQKRAEAEMAAAAAVTPLIANAHTGPSLAFGWRPSSSRAAVSRLGPDESLRDGPVLMWLDVRDAGHARRASSSPHGAHTLDAMASTSAAAVVTPVCWPIHALLQLAYPTLVEQCPGLSLDQAARVVCAVPPQQRHAAAVYQRLRLDDAPAARTITTRAACGPSATFTASTRGATGGGGGLSVLQASQRGFSQTQRSLLPSGHNSATALGDSTGRVSSHYVRRRPMSGSSTTAPNSHTKRRLVSRPQSPSSDMSSGARPCVALPTLYHATSVARVESPDPTAKPATAAAGAATAPSSTVCSPYRGSTTLFPRAWLAALSYGAADRQAQLETVVGQLHVSKA